jgi:hypothetical protein
VHAGLKRAFPGHAVQTVTEIGWRGSKDGPLLGYASERFDVFVTVDRKLEQQQRIATFRVGVVLVRLPDNRIESYEEIFEEIRIAAESVRTGELRVVVSPRLAK